MKGPDLDPRERLQTLGALACVALIAGLVADTPVGAHVALGILLVALFLPVPGAWFVVGWKAVTHRVASAVTAVLLALVYLLVVTPIGLLRRIGARPPETESLFVPADEPEEGPDAASWDRPG